MVSRTRNKDANDSVGRMYSMQKDVAHPKDVEEWNVHRNGIWEPQTLLIETLSRSEAAKLRVRKENLIEGRLDFFPKWLQVLKPKADSAASSFQSNEERGQDTHVSHLTMMVKDLAVQQQILNRKVDALTMSTHAISTAVHDLAEAEMKRKNPKLAPRDSDSLPLALLTTPPSPLQPQRRLAPE